MFSNSKYGNFLTGLLIVAIIVVIILLVFLGYDVYRKHFVTKDAEEFVNNFIENTTTNTVKNNTVDNGIDLNENPFENVTNTPTGEGQTGNDVQMYKGFVVKGTLEIPSIALKYPILETVTKKSIETAVAILYGPGVNEKGNTTIVGHNYRNGLFFSNLKNVKLGDIIFVTDLKGNIVKYQVYNKYETNPEDGEYITRNTNGAREISLSTCTDDVKNRIIIWAKEAK